MDDVRDVPVVRPAVPLARERARGGFSSPLSPRMTGVVDTQNRMHTLILVESMDKEMKDPKACNMGISSKGRCAKKAQGHEVAG